MTATPPGGRKRKQPNPGGGPRKMAQAELKRREALVLYAEAHLSFSEIADRLGVSKTQAWNYVQEAMREVREDRRGLAEFSLDRELQLIEFEIRQMVEIAARPCDACKGKAATNVKVCPGCFGIGKVGDDDCQQCGGEGKVGEWCRICAATGCFYGADERMKAIDRIQRSSDRRAKLEGLYAPQKIDLPFDREFYSDLEKLPPDELDRELKAFLVGVSTGRAREEVDRHDRVR